MATGNGFGIDDALSSRWDPTRASVMSIAESTLLSGLLISAVLGLMAVWSAEYCAAWLTDRSTRPGMRRTFTGAVLFGAVGFAPMLLSWMLSAGLDWSQMWQWGPSAVEKPYISAWPLVRLVFVHSTVVGGWDIIPGSAAAFGLSCLAIVAKNRFRPRAVEMGSTDHDMGGGLILIACVSLISAVVTTLIGLAVMFLIRATAGSHNIILSGGYGLEYLSRALELTAAVVATAAAMIVYRRVRTARLASAVLVALLSVCPVSLVAHQLLYIGFLGLHHRPVEPADAPILTGLFGQPAAAWAVIFTVLMIGITRLVTYVVHRPLNASVSSRREARSYWSIRALGALPRNALIAAVIYIVLVFGVATYVAYCFIALDL
jgi:hypothetical protein